MSEFKSLGEFIISAHRNSKYGIKDERLEQKIAGGMIEGTASAGGYLVAKPLVGPLMMSAQQQSTLWAKSTKLRSNSYGAKIPYLAESARTDAMTGKMAYWIGEATSKTTDYPRMGQLDMTMRKLCILLPVTDELLQDSQLLDDWIDSFAAQRIAWNVDRAILYGDPAVSMGGIMGGGSGNGVIGVASANPLTETVLSAFQAALAPSNEKKAEWFVSKENWNDITDQAQNLMNHHELVCSDDGTWHLFGHRINILEQMTAPCDVMLADMSQYAVVSMGDAIKDVSIQFKYDSDQTYIRWVIRLGGDSFGQSYSLDDSVTYGAFIVPEECAQKTASSSSSETSSSSSWSAGNVSESTSSSSLSSQSESSLSSQSESSHSTESVSSESTVSESSSSADCLDVSGTLDPDITGAYCPNGETYSGQKVYALDAPTSSSDDWYIWYNGSGSWIISTKVGGQQNDFWELVSTDVTGTYSPIGGTYTGDATVA